MTSPAQLQFEFDTASQMRCLNDLYGCIQRLRPKRLQTVFRGLLLAAVAEPRLVDDIDEDGYVIMTASIEQIAFRADVSDRAIQINVDALRKSHPEILTQSASPNKPAQWMFSLKSILPTPGVDWFVWLVENSKSSPRTDGPKVHPELPKSSPRTFVDEKFTPNFLPPYPEQKAQKFTPRPEKVHPELLNLTSICFLTVTASQLAVLAEKLKALGIAVMPAETLGDFWAAPEAFDSVEAVTAIVEALATTRAERSYVGQAAAIARDKETPWGWFRRAILDRYELRPNRQQRAFAATLQRAAAGVSAEELLPRMTAEQAWQKLRTTIAQIDHVHDRDRFVAALGPELHSAAKQVGIGKIANSNPAFQRDLQAAFTAAWNDQALARAVQ